MIENNTNEVQVLKTYPHSFEAEQSILCCILIGGELATNIVPTLSVDAFYDLRHKKIINACKELVRENRRIDLIVVNERLERRNESDLNMFEYLGELTSIVPSAANYEEYIKILERNMILRRLIEACNEITTSAYKGGDEKQILAKAESLIYKVGETYQRGNLESIGVASGEFMAQLNEQSKGEVSGKGLMTHFKRFDSITNGLQPTDLIILAARPSVGKTSFALNIISNIIANKDYESLVAIFSLEMSSVQLVKRVYSALSNISMNSLNRGALSFEEQKQLWPINMALAQSKVYVDETCLQGPAEIIAKCRRLSSTHGKDIGLIVIDYLGLMKSDSNKRNDSKANEVGEISRMLKLAAKELNVPIILICQMSRGIEGRDDKVPKLSDLRDSGSIEQDADIVLFLSRENEGDKGKPNYNVILDISKHRNGELGEIRYNWQGANVRFTESKDQIINRVFEPKTTQKH